MALMGRAWRTAVVVGAFVIGPVAVAGSAAGAGRHRVPATTLGCTDTAFGQVTDPFSSSGGNLVAGPLTWPVLRRYAARLRRSAFRWSGGLGLAVKALAVVKAGSVVRVAVPLTERDRLSLFYGVSADPRKETAAGPVYRVADGRYEVTFRACAKSEATVVASQFPGYFIVRGSQCARIDIYPGAHSPPVKRQIPFGVPERTCPAIP